MVDVLRGATTTVFFRTRAVRNRVRGSSLLLVLLFSVACVQPKRAQLPQLQQRAVFDLGCPAAQLYLVHVDERTKAVTGCGRRLIYLEDCDRGAGNQCSWRLDSPAPGQAWFPGASTTPATPGALSSGWMVPAGPPRPVKRELFEPGAEPTPAAAPTQRTIRTDLYSGGARALPEGRRTRRPIRTKLFGEPEATPANPDQAPPPPTSAPGVPAPEPQRGISTEPPF
jgi:hypothetical protein